VFDRFVVVDWSANSTPKRGRDSIWIAVHHLDSRGAPPTVANVATRSEAEAQLTGLCNGVERTLVGFDFSLGYPAGTAAALGLLGVPWGATWRLLAEEVLDDHRNRNNRFAVASHLNEVISHGPGPFWGCPPAAVTPTLHTTKPIGPGSVGEWRAVERTLRESGHRPFSTWQLLGAGAVGSQSLLGIAMVERLRRHLGARAEVWPFTTGGSAPVTTGGTVVFAEVWPSLLAPGPSQRRVRDARQVDDLARWLADLDARGELSTVMTLASPHVADSVVTEEGWVLGVPG